MHSDLGEREKNIGIIGELFLTIILGMNKKRHSLGLLLMFLFLNNASCYVEM